MTARKFVVSKRGVQREVRGPRASARERLVYPRETWEHFGHAGHFICSYACRFHLCTLVGPWLVSTVGELWFERPSREIHASVHDPAWLAENRHRRGDDFDAAYMKRFGFEEVGCGRKYETMVFRAGKRCDAKDCGCGLPSIDGSELDFAAYNDAGAATRGHLAMCLKRAAILGTPRARKRGERT